MTTSSRKLVVLGGSSPNTPALFAALADSPAPAWAEVCLIGRSAERVERIGQLCAAAAERHGLSTRVTWETDLAHAAQGATCLLNMLRVGGAAAVAEDRRLLAASGVVGHAASYPEAIRHLPPTLAAAKTVEAVAPDAVFVNFANPVSILCEAIAAHTALTCFGICHHAFGLRTDFARVLGVPPTQVRVEYLGLNHLGWVTNVLVDGASRMADLVERLVRARSKAYDYPLISALGAIPIKHAAALYYKGEVLYVRQYGPRTSAVDVVLRSGVGGAPVRRFLEGRELRADRAPHVAWYASCIVPFLDALGDPDRHEFVMTWRHDGAVTDLPGQTAETTALLSNGQAAAVPLGTRLPEAAREWLRQVRASERLLLQAVDRHSPALLVEALAVHPSVASMRHAQQLVAALQPFDHA